MIEIGHLWARGSTLLIGLKVTSQDSVNFIIGCSLSNSDGKIFDHPARRLLSSGNALWGKVSVNNEFAKRDANQAILKWEGAIRFSIWSSTDFTKRLADTGWDAWSSINLVTSSLVGETFQDDEILSVIEHDYGGFDSRWSPL